MSANDHDGCLRQHVASPLSSPVQNVEVAIARGQRAAAAGTEYPPLARMLNMGFWYDAGVLRPERSQVKLVLPPAPKMYVMLSRRMVSYRHSWAYCQFQNAGNVSRKRPKTGRGAVDKSSPASNIIEGNRRELKRFNKHRRASKSIEKHRRSSKSIEEHRRASNRTKEHRKACRRIEPIPNDGSSHKSVA